ncbi:MAG: response regulator [Desulfobacteraceae bacterium]|nr:response regulator [Desulfobacteraceae bacterium]
MKGKPVNILLVEDNEDHIDLTLRALKNNNLINDIHVVKDGQEALDFVYHRGKYEDTEKYPRPGLIILDIHLPKVNGLEVLETLKKDHDYKSIPIIMLTTSSRDEEIARSYAGGANSYVTKPVNFEEFMKKIKSMKLYWTIVNSLPKE